MGMYQIPKLYMIVFNIASPRAWTLKLKPKCFSGTGSLSVTLTCLLYIEGLALPLTSLTTLVKAELACSKHYVRKAIIIRVNWHRGFQPGFVKRLVNIFCPEYDKCCWRLLADILQIKYVQIFLFQFSWKKILPYYVGFPASLITQKSCSK